MGSGSHQADRGPSSKQRQSERFVVANSIDDAHFLTRPEPDGHVEHGRWASAKSFREKADEWKPRANEKALADLRRLQAATLPLPDQDRGW